MTAMTMTEAAGFGALLVLACSVIVALAIAGHCLLAQAREQRARRAYRRERDLQRKLARDLRNSRPHGNVRRAA